MVKMNSNLFNPQGVGLFELQSLPPSLKLWWTS